MNTDDDAVLHKGYVRRFGVDVAGRVGVAPEVIAALRTIEELCLERAFQSLSRYLYFDRGGGTNGREQKSKGKKQTEERSGHGCSKHKGSRSFVCAESAFCG